MVTRRLWCGVGLASIIMFGCGPDVSASSPAGTSFSGYRTIAYAGRSEAPPEGYARAVLPREARATALLAAEQTLRDKGWRAAAVEDADVVVYAGIGRRTRLERFSSVTGQSYEVPVEKGTIVLDAYDRRTGAPVWRGQVEGTVRPPVDDLQALRRAVAALLSRFPEPRPQ